MNLKRKLLSYLPKLLPDSSLNKLDTIFDKKKVEERRVLARLFAKDAFEQLHYWEPKTKEEKVAKSLAHAVVAESRDKSFNESEIEYISDGCIYLQFDNQIIKFTNKSIEGSDLDDYLYGLQFLIQ